jgi:hypothetical protein
VIENIFYFPQSQYFTLEFFLKTYRAVFFDFDMTMETSQLCFNIIYVRGTVRKLTIFLDSLLQWSDCQFRLVANGCSSEEVDYLKQLSEANDRLQLLVFPSNKVVVHSAVLNHLQLLDKDKKFFCFVDSDIFAIDHFLDGLSGLSDNYVGFFSGAPTWVKKKEYKFQPDFDIVGGYYHFMDNDICLGSTFFAIYKNEVLNKVIQETGVGFQGYLAKDIPSDLIHVLKELNLLKYSYDTGKLLNILLQVKGHKITYQDNASLIHIGGINFNSNDKAHKWSFNRRFVYALFGEYLGSNLFLFLRKHLSNSMPHIKNKIEKQLQIEQVFRRGRIRKYMTALVNSLESNTEPPKIPITKDAEIKDKLITTAKEIALIYEARDVCSTCSNI